MSDVVKIGIRLKETRIERGYTQEELGKALGINKSTVQRYETGKIIKLKLPVIEAFAKYLYVNPAWLVFKSDVKEPSSGLSSLPEDAMPYNPKVHKIPILGKISAGLPLYADEHIEDYTYTELNGGAEYFALRVKGDSMNAAKINDGDILIIRRQEKVENGEIAVVMVNKENATVKRFKKDKNIVQLIPQSFNPEHNIQIYDLKSDEIRILGKVVECKIKFS